LAFYARLEDKYVIHAKTINKAPHFAAHCPIVLLYEIEKETRMSQKKPGYSRPPYIF
jgi:hypothetical protein